MSKRTWHTIRVDNETLRALRYAQAQGGVESMHNAIRQLLNLAPIVNTRGHGTKRTRSWSRKHKEDKS